MKLLSLEMSGVRHLPEMRLSFGDAGAVPPVSVLTGPPASGTTTVLEVIAASVARLRSGGQAPEASDIVGMGGSVARLRTQWLLDRDERAFAGMPEEMTEAQVYYRTSALPAIEADPGLLGIMSRYSHDPEIGKVVLIPAARVSESSFARFSSFEAEMRLQHLSTDPSKFSAVTRAVVMQYNASGDRQKFARIAELFGELNDSTQLIGIGASGSPELARRGRGLVTISRASHSEKNAFLFAALTVLMGLDKSVVLLDTPELGLAPGMARKWMTALSRATHDAQWIVATRDPDLIDSVPAAARVELRGSR